jgi:hypothetical protein
MHGHPQKTQPSKPGALNTHIACQRIEPLIPGVSNTCTPSQKIQPSNLVMLSTFSYSQRT